MQARPRSISRPATRAATPSRATNDNVQELLHAILNITTNVARTIGSTPRPPTELDQTSVERIVKRTQLHFASQLEARDRELAVLREALKAASDERDSLRAMTEDLKGHLYTERRHRLECEEQSQRMNEEHTKLVYNLEQRIRKLDNKSHETASQSNRCTPRSSRNPGRTDDESAYKPAPLSTSAVNDFLSSIGRELDAINALEATRERTLNAI
jgi:chromosome segregation ATPase